MTSNETTNREVVKILESIKDKPAVKTEIYRALRATHVEEDVVAHLDDIKDKLNEYENVDTNDLIDTVVYRYVYENRYDCNLSYWQNIDNLINEYLLLDNE